MLISEYTIAQAMDMGITEAAVRQATEANTPEACNCEHARHFSGKVAHAFRSAPAGSHWAQFVGKVCDNCAETCMANMRVS